MKKTAFCICKNKDADQLRSNCAADQTVQLISAFVLAIQIVKSLYFINPKSLVSNQLLWLYTCTARFVSDQVRNSDDRFSHNKAHMIWCISGAVEKQKLVYILNRDAQARLTISSPLEAHKANTLVYHMVGVDVGFENPTFACLEIDYEVLLKFLIF